MTSTLTIVRHGNTFASGEPPRRVGARTDLPLVESGRAQANAVGRAFAAAGARFDRVLCSPLRRTTETARLILAELQEPPAIEPCDWLAEIDHGPDENALEADVIARIGAEALAAWDEHGVAPPGWTVDAERRIAAWRAILSARGASDALLVTSNGAARFALLADPRLRAEAEAEASFKLRTGAWGRILAGPAGARLDGWDVRP